VKRFIRTTCPRDCYDGCGIAVELVDDQIQRVLGDPEHPVSRGRLCAKSALAYNGVWRDRAARLDRPLLRKGAKGLARFEPISWRDALARIGERLGGISAKHGAESILHAHYTGTCSLLAGDFPMRFFHRLGATEVEPDTICNNAGHVALSYVFGSSDTSFDPKTLRDCRCVVIWGANPSASAPHAHEHWLQQAPGSVIAIDPVRHATAERADIHLQPHPGSDAALAFALMHVIRRQGLIDREFLRAHTLGWEALEPLVEGATPEWARETTGVPVEALEKVAELYAAGPSLLWLGQGMQRQLRGGNAVRACAMLPAITGNLGKPGAGIYYLNGTDPRNIDADYVCASHLRTGPERSISHMDLPDALSDPERSRAFLCWNMNPAASGPRQRALQRALSRDDLFSVAIDLFQTDTADYADIVLPAASFLEFDDLVVPYFHLYLSAQVKAENPPGQALPNPEIFRRLSRAMGFEEPELYESDREILDTILSRTGLGIDFAELAHRGTIDPFPEPVIQFAGPSFPTPSGRVELASAGAVEDGHPAVPQPHADPRPSGAELRLLSPASEWLSNSSYGNDPKIQHKLGEPLVYINPEDARSLGLTDGAQALLSNETGRLVLGVAISDAVPPGVALAHKGRWPRLDSERANVNVLNPGLRTDMGESSSVHSTRVRIAPQKDGAMDTLRENQRAFSDQSQGFSSDGDTYADAEELAWMLKDLPVSPDAEALDIATGTGEFARALAPHVATVIGLDATDAMLERGKKFVEEAGVENISFQKGLAEGLPFEDETFDIVSSRYAFHHFADPKPVISEMARVCKTGGHVIIVDIIVPDESTAAEYNYHEWLCDRSHTRCLDPEEFQTCFRLFGMEVVSARTRVLENELIEWMDFSLTEKAHREEILRAVHAELGGGPKTGLAPYEENSILCFKQLGLSIVGRKLPR